ncbi:MAG: PqqD family protein [Anaerolineaceae bacterium]
MKEEIRYHRNPDFIFRKIAEETVLVPLHKDVADMDCIYTLNGVGAFIWEQLDQPASLEDLQSAVLNEYAAEPEMLMNDLKTFLDAMTAIDAIREGAL